MASSAPTLAALARTMDAVLAAALDDHDRAGLRPDDPAGVWLASERPVQRLGLRLDGGAPPYRWARRLDAVLVHRPFGLWPRRLPTGVGVVAYHGTLDAWLWTAAQPALATALGVVPDASPLFRGARRIGIVGPAPPDLMARLAALTGPPAACLGDPQRAVGLVAVLGAMTDALVREAAARGATHLITGQMRQPGIAAARATGLTVVATGQDQAEAWALRSLAGAAAARWPGLDLVDQTAAPPRA